MDSPNSADYQGNSLLGIDCVTKNNCYAVGSHTTGDGLFSIGQDATLAQRWNGTSWSILASPSASLDTNILQGIACTSASKCWAVGYYNPGNDVVLGNPGQTLIERWDGNSWAIDSSAANPRTGQLKSIACVSPSECWAVGEQDDHYDPALTAMNVTSSLIERWDGNSWNVFPSPNVSGPFDNRFRSVACGSSECWAVGDYTEVDLNTGGRLVSRTLIVHYAKP